MNAPEFEALVVAALKTVPEKFLSRLTNVAILIEDEPSEHTLREQGIHPGEGTLLGLYQGIPLTERGVEYGVGGTLPDTITLYRLPILASSEEDGKEVAEVVRETVWHEIAHYFGMDEAEVGKRENEKTNRYAL